MTLQELYKEVAQLGFEDSIGDDGADRFIFATNRALLEVNSLRPRKKRIDLNHRVPTNLILSEPKVIEKRGGEDLVFTVNGAKSFYFEVCGEGAFEVGIKQLTKKKDGEKEVIEEGLVIDNRKAHVEFNSFTFKKVKGFIKYNGAFIDNLMRVNNVEGSNITYPGEVQITFKGDYDYTIRNLAMYDRVYSSSEESIPEYSSKIAYDITSFVNDFERFDATPIDSKGKRLYEGYSIEGNIIYLPLERQGVYTANYLHKVTAIPLDADFSASATTTIEIDLEDDLAALMPNLIAAYVWLDDEAEKSQYYYSLYQQRAEQIKRNIKDLNPIEFESVYGW